MAKFRLYRTFLSYSVRLQTLDPNKPFLISSIGNDHDEDSDKEPEPAPKVIDKPTARTSKRNAPDTAPNEARGAAIGGDRGDRGGRGGRRGGYGGNDEGVINISNHSVYMSCVC